MSQSILVQVFLVSFLFLFGSCNRKVQFTKEELRWITPYSHDDTIVYRSPSNKTDTIIFYQAEFRRNHTSNFEQGFYDTYSYSTNYELTNGSYHKLDPPEKGASTLFHIGKSTEDPAKANQEFCFLGLIFNAKFLNQISSDTSDITLFDQTNAQYQGMNINEGIKSFEFQKGKGIISFIDKNNVQWIQMNH